MKYQVGDRILIIHSGEEGDVIEIINDKMMIVDVEGVKFPVYMDQVDFPYYKRFTEQKSSVVKKEKKYVDDLKKERTDENKVADGMWLNFLPVMATDEHNEERVKELKLHMVNNTHDVFHFKYRQSFFGKNEFYLENQLSPFENFYLHDIPFSDFSDSPVFEFELALMTPDKTKEDYYENSVRLKPKQLFDRITKMKEENKATFSYQLFEKYPDKKPVEQMDISAPSGKSKAFDASRVRQQLEPAQSVIDLHIEKLADDWRSMTNFEILSLQLKTFEKYYDLAVAHTQPSLIVIHGVGEGKLRNEIHEILQTKNEVKNFVNQYHPLYGFGATEIFFSY